MYKNNEIIKLYNYDDNQVIWRYMDFTKFLSMLQYQALFFCTCKKMQDMDPFEGEYPKRNLEKIQKEKEFWQLQDIDSLVNRKQEVSNSEIFNTLCEYYFPLIMSKRKEFEYGNEIRLVSPIRQSTRRKRVKDFGKLVDVDLDVLINSIIVSPNATDWFVNLVKDTMKSYNLEHKKVYQSKIYEKIYN